MNLQEIYSENQKTILSFEVFPPDTEIESLYGELAKLKKYSPALISLTYGAAGKNKEFSTGILTQLKDRMNFEVMPHFTCICNSKAAVEKNLAIIEKLGIKNILALRGDIPEDKTLCSYDFIYANELIEFIKNKTNLSIAAAGYPEGHIESPDLKTDIENLKRKVDAGASVIYTQLFFDNNKFFSYVEKVRKAGINIPVIPGIMPVLSIKQVNKMTGLARISIPDKMKKNFEKYKNSPEDIKKFGTEYGTCQCAELLDNKVKGLHFFTLNKARAASEILDNLKEKL